MNQKKFNAYYFNQENEKWKLLGTFGTREEAHNSIVEDMEKLAENLPSYYEEIDEDEFDKGDVEIFKNEHFIRYGKIFVAWIIEESEGEEDDEGSEE